MASQLKTTEQQNALKDAMACAKEISAKLTQAAPGASAKTKDTVEPAAKKPHTDTVDHADPKVLAQQIEFSLDVMIEKSKIGLVIGKGGDILKSLQELTGCKMVLNQEGIYEHSQEKPMRITGEQSACMYAKHLISKELENVNSKPVSKTPSGNVTEVTVPKSFVGLIIGTHGTTVNKIQDETGCRIDFKGEYDDGEPTQTAQLTGTPKQVEKAKIKINEVIENEKRKQNGMPPLGTKKMIIEVPASKCASVIGKHGGTIRRIKAETHIEIQLDRSIPLSAPFGVFHVTGTERMIEDACAIIRDKTNDWTISAKPVQGQDGLPRPWGAPPNTDHSNFRAPHPSHPNGGPVYLDYVSPPPGYPNSAYTGPGGPCPHQPSPGFPGSRGPRPDYHSGPGGPPWPAAPWDTTHRDHTSRPAAPWETSPGDHAPRPTAPWETAPQPVAPWDTAHREAAPRPAVPWETTPRYPAPRPAGPWEPPWPAAPWAPLFDNINLNNNLPPETKEMVIEVPASKCGSVIGKGGETICAIKTETHIEIQLDQSIPLSAPFRIFHVTGTESMIEDTCAIIREKTNDWSISAKPVQGQDGPPRPWGAPPTKDHSNFRAPHPSHPYGGPGYSNYVAPPPGYLNAAYTGPGGPCPHQPSPGFPGSRGPSPDYHSGPGGPPWPAAPWDTTHRDHASQPAAPWETSPGDHAPRPTAPWETAPRPVAPWDIAHREAAPRPAVPWETTPRDPAPWETATSTGVPRPTVPWETV